jgi:hypothetical protein
VTQTQRLTVQNVWSALTVSRESEPTSMKVIYENFEKSKYVRTSI